jgi:E3 ubiquitin-protein ligase NEDD4
VTETVELVPKGGDLTVDNSNLPDYLDEQLKYRTLTRIQPQLAEFLKGFYDVVPEPFLSVFDFQVCTVYGGMRCAVRVRVFVGQP